MISRSGGSPGEGNGNSLQYSCLEKPMDREAWKAAVHGVAEGRTRLSDFMVVDDTIETLDNWEKESKEGEI